MQETIIRHQVRSEDQGRLDLLLASLLKISRAQVRGLLDQESVTVNDAVCRNAGQILTADDRLTIPFDPKRRYREKPQARAPQGFELLYSDAELAIVNKAAGILTVPTDRRESDTLIDRLARFLAKGQSRYPKLHVVHRLDRDTSGVLVFGRNSRVTEELIRQFAARKPEREYRALVAGRVPDDEGSIRSHLATDKSLNQKSAAQGELAITHYRVLERYSDATLLSVCLETGRRNQIRVHCAEMGHPVLGDTRYCPEAAWHRAWPYKRLALHAHILGFIHPALNRELRFESPMPPEFERFRERQRSVSRSEKVQTAASRPSS